MYDFLSYFLIQKVEKFNCCITTCLGRPAAALSSAETRTAARGLGTCGPSFPGVTAFDIAETRTAARVLGTCGPSLLGTTASASSKTRAESSQIVVPVLVPVPAGGQLDLSLYFSRFGLIIPTTFG